MVACEINKDGTSNASFSASTPPLEAKKILFTKYASSPRSKKLRISFVDIRKAYFNGVPERAIYMSLPKELGLHPGLVARQVRCVYGTRDAGKIWEDCYTQVLEASGFVAGASNPCIFYHATRDLSVVVHGDDFTALGSDKNLDWYEAKLAESFELKIRGRLGEGCTGPQQIRILNRIVTLDDTGLTYEADPRHVDLLLSSLGLTAANSSATPGVKPSERDINADKCNESDDKLLDPTDPNAAIAAICSDMGKDIDFHLECVDIEAAGEPGTPLETQLVKACSGDTGYPHFNSTNYVAANSGNAHELLMLGDDPVKGENCLPFSQCVRNYRQSIGAVTTLQNSNHDDDIWQSSNNGVHTIHHAKFRRTLQRPVRINHAPLASMRLSIGVMSNGQRFSRYDNWRSQSTNDLLNTWIGSTYFFDRDNTKIDEQLDIICALHDSHSDTDIDMSPTPKVHTVRFDLSRNSSIDITPYSECYDKHPHFILSTATGWKTAPSRSDFFTGKSAEVMKARRKSTKSHFRSSRARKSRLRVMEEANRKLGRTMDVDAASGITDSAMDIDSYNMQHGTTKKAASTNCHRSAGMQNAASTNCHRSVGTDVVMIPVFATRTKPLNNNILKKRVGAKMTTLRNLNWSKAPNMY